MDNTFDYLGKLSWDDLIRLRAQYKENQQMQQFLAPYEHRAWMREYAKEHPVKSAVGMPLIIPSYAAAKMFDRGLYNLTGKGMITDEQTTPPSIDQITQGYRGLWEGLLGK